MIMDRPPRIVHKHASRPPGRPIALRVALQSHNAMCAEFDRLKNCQIYQFKIKFQKQNQVYSNSLEPIYFATLE